MARILSAGRAAILGALLVPLVFAAACSDAVRPPGPDLARSSETLIRTPGGGLVPYHEMQDIMARLAHHVAVALGDPATRLRVYEALRTSPFRENKLHFRSLINDERVALREAIADRSGVPEAAVSAALDSIVDLEFYMPVKEHWAVWEGDADLLVASFPDDDGSTPRGFDLLGQEILLSPDVPPNTPTLVLTPVETDFSVTASTGGEAAQVMPYADSAWVMTNAAISQSHEGWGKGDPEFEAHTWQEQPSGIVEVIICAGNEMPAPYWWDMNGTNWGPDSVLLATQAIIDTLVITEFQMWEDDTDACNNSGGGKPPKGGSDWAAAMEALQNLIIEVTNVFLEGGNWQKVKAVHKSIGYAYDFGTAVDADEFVGIMLGPDGGCWPSDGPAFFPIREDPNGASKGWAAIDVTYGERDPICDLTVTMTGPSVVPSTQEWCIWEANASYGTPPYTLTWTGVASGSGSQLFSSVSGEGYLYVEVEDSMGRTDDTFMYISIDPEVDPPECSE